MMGVEITGAMINAAAGALTPTGSRPVGQVARDVLEAALAAAPSPVGVTSSDDRPASGDLALPVQWNAERGCYEDAPSSDEPEGLHRALDAAGAQGAHNDPVADRIANLADQIRHLDTERRILEDRVRAGRTDEAHWPDGMYETAAMALYCARYPWPDGYPWQKLDDDQRELYRREAKAVADDLTEHLRALIRPEPVGDAEPVQWGLEDENGEIVGTARMRDEAESLAAELLGGLDLKVVPLYRLPVSSQDAGALVASSRAEYAQLRESDDRVINELAQENEQLRANAVDLVLPAEGERRDELVAAGGLALVEAQAEFDENGKKGVWQEEWPDPVTNAVIDALRAAAGKAGSDDA